MADSNDAQDLSQKKGMIAAVLIGVNVLCIAALAGASMFGRRGAHSEAVAEKANVTASSAKAEPTAAATAAAATATATAAATAAAEATAAPTATADATAAVADAKSAEPADEGSAAPTSTCLIALAARNAKHGVVLTPGGHARANLHAKPEMKAALVGKLPSGTKISITNKTTVGKQLWYQVKTVDFQPETSGWLHASIVKQE